MAVVEISKQTQKGKAPVTKMEVKRAMPRRGRRMGPRNGTGPLGGTSACPYSASEQISCKS